MKPQTTAQCVHVCSHWTSYLSQLVNTARVEAPPAFSQEKSGACGLKVLCSFQKSMLCEYCPKLLQTPLIFTYFQQVWLHFELLSSLLELTLSIRARIITLLRFF
jgi:hypothetical protein